MLVAAASFAVSWYFNEINGNRGKNSYTATVTIEQGSGPLTIGRVLQQQGVIRSAQIFRLYVKQEGVADTLQYGTFELSSAMSYDEIIEALQQTQDDRETVRVTFPEGITATQFAARMEEAGLCTADEFLDVANNADFSQFEFWAHRDEDPAQFMKSEGYLFPDTYDFFVGDDVYNMVARIYQEFNTKYLENDLQGQGRGHGLHPDAVYHPRLAGAGGGGRRRASGRRGGRLYEPHGRGLARAAPGEQHLQLYQERQR